MSLGTLYLCGIGYKETMLGFPLGKYYAFPLKKQAYEFAQKFNIRHHESLQFINKRRRNKIKCRPYRFKINSGN